MENEHILTVDQFKELARPTSKHIDENDVQTYIRECEDIIIIPAVGLERFKALCQTELSESDKILLEGGEYTDKAGNLTKCPGLHLALSYFVYAKLMMGNGGMLTRTGMMLHNDSYATREDDKNRVRHYDDAMNVAEAYLEGCLQYMRVNNETANPVRGSRLRIHAIGD